MRLQMSLVDFKDEKYKHFWKAQSLLFYILANNFENVRMLKTDKPNSQDNCRVVSGGSSDKIYVYV